MNQFDMETKNYEKGDVLLHVNRAGDRYGGAVVLKSTGTISRRSTMRARGDKG